MLRIHIIYTDPDPGSYKKEIADPDLDKNDKDPDLGKRGSSIRKKFDSKKAHFPCFTI